MPDAEYPSPAKPRGVRCPSCCGVRLAVTHVRRLVTGVNVRYRTCSACGTRVKTREAVVGKKCHP